MRLFKYFCLATLFLSTLSAEEQTSPVPATEIENPKSFTYGRVGAFTWIVLPIGVEAAMGHRFRSERWGWGPLINVSAASFFGTYTVLPAVSFKFEALYYPKSWGDWYWGFIPGIGIARMSFDKGPRWDLLPSLELCFGKEFLNSADKREFYYFSISPLLTISFNYGWSF